MEEFFTLEDIEKLEDNNDTLYCISVDSPDKQFLIGDMGVPTHNTDEAKEQESLKGEAGMIIGSIARLGRAAGVHLVIATQRPDAKLIAGETKANLGVRINCGRTNSTASSMILESAEGTKVKPTPRGRLYLSIYEKGDHAQGFFAEQDWIDNYLAEKGLNPDGSPLTGKKSKLANLTDMSTFEQGTLDSREGVDNTSAIDRIRKEEESENDDYEEDWRFEDEDGAETFVDDSDDEDVEPEEENPSDELVRPQLGKAQAKNWERPEDDWDDELDDLIEKNNE